MTKKAKSDVDKFQRLAGLKAIKSKSAMYGGSTDSDGMWTALREIGDNIVDLILKGAKLKANIIFDTDGSIWVTDTGPGIPVDIKTFEDEKGRKEKISIFYAATGLTHAGSNFDSKDTSRGTHGIGIKYSNAVSIYFDGWTFRDKKWYSIKYKDATLKQDVKKDKAPKVPHTVVKNGTVFHFALDQKVFDKGSKMPMGRLKEWAELNSYLIKGLDLTVINQKGKTLRYEYKGPQAYLDKQISRLECELMGKPLIETNDKFDLILAWSNADGNNVNAYTNALYNNEGGEHITVMRSALYKSLDKFKGKTKFNPTHLLEGTVGLINVKLAAPKFNTQVKSKLVDERVKEYYDDFLAAFDNFWAKNKGLATAICKRAADIHAMMEDVKISKAATAELKNVVKGRVYLPEKLAVSLTKNAKERELYIVEGDSAKGTCTQARNKKFQEVMPIKGKITNVFKAKSEKVLQNPDIINVLKAIGYDPSKKDPCSSLRVGKVIILPDADPDGRHIAILVSALFLKFLRPLVESGGLYIGRTPLFTAKVGAKDYYGDSLEEIQAQVPKGKNPPILRMKGLGEASVSLLNKSAFDPVTRNVTQLTMKDVEKMSSFYSMLNEDVAARRTLLGLN